MEVIFKTSKDWNSVHQNPLGQPLWHDVRYSDVRERLRLQSGSRAVTVHDILDSYPLCVDIKVY